MEQCWNANDDIDVPASTYLCQHITEFHQSRPCANNTICKTVFLYSTGIVSKAAFNTFKKMSGFDDVLPIRLKETRSFVASSSDE